MSTEVRRPSPVRDDYYESMSRTIRWIIMAMVLISCPPAAPNYPIVLTLLFLAALYNLLRYDQKLKPLAFFSSRLHSLIADHVFALAIIALTGGLGSPYYPLVFLLIIASVSSFGILGFVYSLSSQLVTSVILMNFDVTPQPSSPQFQFIIKIILVIIFSLVAEQSVRSKDDEYLLESEFSKEVENERTRLRSLINALSTAFLAVDAHGKVYLYNSAALGILNTHHRLAGRSLHELMPLRDRRGHRVDLLKHFPTTGEPLSRQDVVFRASDGSDMVLDITVTAVHAFGTSQGGGYLVMFKDITKQKSLSEQRDEFISVISHELRTPLAITEANLSTALLPGYADIPAKAKTLLEQAHQNTVFLSKLIQDLATISRAEQDDLPVELELVDSAALAQELARDYAPQVEHKHLELELEIGTGVGSVVTDAPQLREILQNFLTNAIKYTSSGTITLAVERQSGGATRFSISDTGIGISASDKSKIFNKFYRSEDYRTRSTGGTGLGLYITRKLADRLGLEIGFDSRLNHGSTFWVSVPVREDHLARHALDAAAEQADD